MNASVYQWKSDDGGLSRSSITVSSRRQLELAIERNLRPLLRLMSRHPASQFTDYIILADAGGDGSRLLGRVRSFGEFEKHLVIDGYRRVENCHDGTQRIGEVTLEQELIPKRLATVVHLHSIAPETTCWNCGEVFVSASTPRIVGKRLFTSPEGRYRRAENLCDECASHLVNQTAASLLPDCAGCGETKQTTVLRKVAEDDDRPIWCCEDCASVVDVSIRDRVVMQSPSTS